MPLEQRQRLSRSVLWKVLRNFYVGRGIEAWNSADAVPHHVTSNPFIAEAYAKIAVGFLRDWQAAGARAEPPRATFERGAPLYVVELGSGHGRFGYLFLKKFLAAYRHSSLEELPVKYVMTDLAGRNLEFLRAHPRLRPFVAEGVLDFAQFDSERDDELRLIESGESLRPEGVRNPLILVANYFFDSIPQDAFNIEGGRLYESLVTISSDKKGATPDDPGIISHLELSYQSGPADEDYYDDPEWNRILANCRRRLPSTSFLFPTAALSCVGKFHDLAGGRLLLLSADKGYSQDEALLQGFGAPGIALHGSSFSMMVDYHIIGDYVQSLGGKALHPTHQHQSISISAFMFGGPPDGYVETRQAYREAVEAFGPDDFFTLVRGVEMFYGSLSLEQLLSFLRLSRWDYHVLWSCLPALKESAPSAPENLKREIYEAVGRVWDAYLPIGEEGDLAFHLGTLLLEMDLYAEALEFLQHSVDLYGEEPGTVYNMAVCCHGLRQTAKALEYVNRALELDAEFDAAKALRIKLLSAAAR